MCLELRFNGHVFETESLPRPYESRFTFMFSAWCRGSETHLMVNRLAALRRASLILAMD